MFLKEEIKNIKSGKRELRQFGITLGTVLGLLGSVFFLRGREYYPYFLVLSFAFLFSGLAAPGILKPAQKIWMALGVCIGWVMTRVILAVLFYLVITPIALIAGIFGKRFLDTAFDRTTDSYWIAREPDKFDKKSYENQF
jgi:hypothetical protein